MRSVLVVGVLLLSGCASNVLQADKPVQLLPGEGIAGIVLNAPTRITQISYKGMSPGTKDFEVPDTQGGWTLYLVPVPAGRYCLQHFLYWRTIFNSTEDLGCLTVLPGKISYGGDIMPSILPDHAETDQQYNPIPFNDELHKQYPAIAAAYPVAASAPPPAGVELNLIQGRVSAWDVNAADGKSQEIYLRNNTSWSLKVTDVTLSECENLKQTCDKADLNVVLAPFATQRVFVVEPLAAQKPYSYSYNYDYQNVD